MKRKATDITNCTCANLRKANRVVTQAFDAALQPSGLRATQFALLATLQKLDNPSLTKLAGVMVMDRTTLTRNLKPLVNRDLISTGTEQDQRVRKIQLTAEGLQVLNEAMPLWQQIQGRVVDRLGKDRWAQFLEDLAITVEVIKMGH